MRILLITGFYPGERTGGAEVQTMLLAQGLVARGHEMFYLATATGHQNCYTTDDGIVVQDLPGWAIVGETEHRRQIIQAITGFGPDVCYVRLLLELAVVSDACVPLNIPVVSISVSQKETSPILQGGSWRETLLYWRSTQPWRHWRSFQAIHRSAIHLCNTKELTAHIQPRLNGVPVKTIYNAAPDAPPDEIHSTLDNQVIWVNNFKRLKRPELYIELARRLPDYKFVMIGAIPKHGRYAGQVRKMLKQAPSNLHYLGYLPLDAVNKHIGQSDLLLYTSTAEGFGNSFLQAWFRSVPTGSLSSRLDGILEQEKIGFYADDFEELVSKTEWLMQHRDLRFQLGQNARTYALAHHSIDALVDAYETLFSNVAAGRKIN